MYAIHVDTGNLLMAIALEVLAQTSDGTHSRNNAVNHHERTYPS